MMRSTMPSTTGLRRTGRDRRAGNRSHDMSVS